MPVKAFFVQYCARCDDEVGREEAPADGAAAKTRAPAYFRQKTVETADGPPTLEEKALDYLCKKCKKDVDNLDGRIFNGGRTRTTEGGSDA